MPPELVRPLGVVLGDVEQRLRVRRPLERRRLHQLAFEHLPGRQVLDREHVLAEALFWEGTRAIEHGAIKVFVERDFAALERRDYHLVPAAEFLFVNLEMLQRLGALGVVPCVGEQDAAHIPKERANRRQGIPPREAWLVR